LTAKSHLYSCTPVSYKVKNSNTEKPPLQNQRVQRTKKQNPSAAQKPIRWTWYSCSLLANLLWAGRMQQFTADLTEHRLDPHRQSLEVVWQTNEVEKSPARRAKRRRLADFRANGVLAHSTIVRHSTRAKTTISRGPSCYTIPGQMRR